MLMLTRRLGETIMIGDEITVTVLGVKGNQVKLGVVAPSDIEVHREEVYHRIALERARGESQNTSVRNTKITIKKSSKKLKPLSGS